MRPVQLLITAALVIAVLSSFAMAGRATEVDDEYLGLPDAPGREEVFVYCGACHSMKLVVQQGQTRSGWSELLTWMTEEQEMEPLDQEDSKLVLDFLTKYIGPDTHQKRLRQRGVLN
jgi:cytochrome c